HSDRGGVPGLPAVAQRAALSARRATLASPTIATLRVASGAPRVNLPTTRLPLPRSFSRVRSGPMASPVLVARAGGGQRSRASRTEAGVAVIGGPPRSSGPATPMVTFSPPFRPPDRTASLPSQNGVAPD